MLLQLEFAILDQETQYIVDLDRYKVSLSNFKQPENTQFS